MINNELSRKPGYHSGRERRNRGSHIKILNDLKRSSDFSEG
jgi:hypothetical protein